MIGWIVGIVVFFMLAGFVGQSIAVVQDVWKNGSIVSKVFFAVITAAPILAIVWIVILIMTNQSAPAN
jgi:uncharacterized membrane protein